MHASAHRTSDPITAYVTWAPGGSTPKSSRAWLQTVLDFATALRRLGGIDADLDLWHKSSHVNWTTFGVDHVRDSDFVIIAVSAAYRQRWEETGDDLVHDPRVLREANAIKSIFERDPSEFRTRVKVVLLPGATISDIPMELLTSTNRYRIDDVSLPGLTPLLRALHSVPEAIKPPIGVVPPLPPEYIAEISPPGARPTSSSLSGAQMLDHASEQTLHARLQEIDARLEAITSDALATVAGDELRAERDVVAGSLLALKRASAVEEGHPAAADAAPHAVQVDELEEATAEALQAIEQARAAMRRLPAIAREALYQYWHNQQPLTVGGTLDRFSVEDAIRSEEDGYLNWVEDEEQTVTARRDHPRVGAAHDALAHVRSVAFDGITWSSRARAAPWARAILHEKYEIDDPEFELRPVWVQLGFLAR